jgi:hypothetical protein
MKRFVIFILISAFVWLISAIIALTYKSEFFAVFNALIPFIAAVPAFILAVKQ